MVSLEGANSGDPSGDPLGILRGSESKTGDPGVLYPKKPKDSGGSCATSVPLYNIKRKEVWERGEVSVGRMRRSRILLRLRSLSRNLLHLRNFDPWPKSDPDHMEANALSFFGSKKSCCTCDPWPKKVPKTKWKQMRFRSLAPKSCLLYTSPSQRDKRQSRMPSSA